MSPEVCKRSSGIQSGPRVEWSPSPQSSRYRYRPQALHHAEDRLVDPSASARRFDNEPGCVVDHDRRLLETLWRSPPPASRSRRALSSRESPRPKRHHGTGFMKCIPIPEGGLSIRGCKGGYRNGRRIAREDRGQAAPTGRAPRNSETSRRAARSVGFDHQLGVDAASRLIEVRIRASAASRCEAGERSLLSPCARSSSRMTRSRARADGRDVDPEWCPSRAGRTRGRCRFPSCRRPPPRRGLTP